MSSNGTATCLRIVVINDRNAPEFALMTQPQRKVNTSRPVAALPPHQPSVRKEPHPFSARNKNRACFGAAYCEPKLQTTIYLPEKRVYRVSLVTKLINPVNPFFPLWRPKTHTITSPGLEIYALLPPQGHV